MLWNNVETKPYGFFPTGWTCTCWRCWDLGVWKDGVYQGKTVFEAAATTERVLGWQPQGEHWAHPNVGEDGKPAGAT
ncbi:MAG: hypothetical protein U0531_20075 [Dehalococcoidia bacterium]